MVNKESLLFVAISSTSSYRENNWAEVRREFVAVAFVLFELRRRFILMS